MTTPDRSVAITHLEWTSRTRDEPAMLRGDNCHRIGVLHHIGSVEFGNAVLKQCQHQPGPGRDQRSQRREAEFTRKLGMDDCARIRIRIDAVACDLDFLVPALPVHLRIDAKAGCASEDLKCLLKSLAFYVGPVGARGPRSRSSTITLKKSSRSGSTSTIPRSFVGTSSNSTPPHGSIRNASTISGTRPVARIEATTSGIEYQSASSLLA
jgi:hypothetical protein